MPRARHAQFAHQRHLVVTRDAVGADEHARAALQEFPGALRFAVQRVPHGAVDGMRAGSGEELHFRIVNVNAVRRQHIGSQESNVVQVGHTARTKVLLNGGQLAVTLRHVQVQAYPFSGRHLAQP
ncbi:MAG: hypothetical protein BWY63_00358 [Chloroflexi bacterium ADurb.Bin360]|nr:MAG: hypothetical protein BWY63_00358 [Chloroflexi bacterium ADurb.Bin360]